MLNGLWGGSMCVTVSVNAVLPAPDKHSRPHSLKTTATIHFRSFHNPLSKNLPLHDISKHKNNKKQKNIKIWGRDFVMFFSALYFWIKHYTNFLNLTKFVSQHLIATHVHFHWHKFPTENYFFTACYELFSGGHGYLATLFERVRTYLRV
jgi:hypothetical protein